MRFNGNYYILDSFTKMWNLAAHQISLLFLVNGFYYSNLGFFIEVFLLGFHLFFKLDSNLASKFYSFILRADEGEFSVLNFFFLLLVPQTIPSYLIVCQFCEQSSPLSYYISSQRRECSYKLNSFYFRGQVLKNENIRFSIFSFINRPNCTTMPISI